MDVNGQNFEIVKLLGKGKGGYSYLAMDGVRQYVLKQIHHEPCDYYQFGDKLASELRDYGRLQQVGIRMSKLLAVDEKQERLLKEFIDGPTIYDLILQDKVEPHHIHQVEEMCQALYANGMNIDYFPTNFVVQAGEVYYIDYECNAYAEQWDFAHWGIGYWSKTPQLLEYAKNRGDIL